MRMRKDSGHWSSGDVLGRHVAGSVDCAGIRSMSENIAWRNCDLRLRRREIIIKERARGRSCVVIVCFLDWRSLVYWEVKEIEIQEIDVFFLWRSVFWGSRSRCCGLFRSVCVVCFGLLEKVRTLGE
jgi:hypothetical protein